MTYPFAEAARRATLAPVLAVALAASSGGVQAAKIDIPYERFTLPNGLRVVVHTDRKAPIVAVNVWYHVGSKDEPAGRTGFAHLFEHLMFQGSENYRGEFFEPFELVGATDINGTTSTDRTNYFQNVPTTALDMALWMESDRMGHFLGAIDGKLLDEQRGVVQNEKRQGENQPYGRVWDALSAASYPPTHPYHHSTIGSMADLDAASLDDVKTWFRTWYGPNNAVLVLAGDIDLATAKDKVTKYFGDISAGPTMAQPKVDIAARTQSTRETMSDRVAQTRIYRAWNVPQQGTVELDRLQLFTQVLGGSKSSRLDRRLLFQDRLVDNIGAFAEGSQLSGNVLITADVKQGVDPAKVEAAIDEELKKLIEQGPTASELAQAKTVFEAGFVRGIERIGGFGGKADTLASCAILTGDPGCFRASLRNVRTATAGQVRGVGAKWLAQGDHTLTVTPGERPPAPEDVSTASASAPPADALHTPDPKFRVIASDVDRSKGVPEVDAFPDLRFPALQRAKLSNGIPLILAERHDVPVVQVSLELSGGFTADAGRKLGTSSFTMSMLDEGAGELGALALADRAESLGASVSAGAALDGANVFLSALKDRLAPSLDLFADVVRRPRFDDKEIERVRQTWLAGIKQEKTRPNGIALRLLPPLLYGQGHAYAIPFSGTGTEASIGSLTRQDLVAFHRDWVRPDNATLLVVGDTTLREIVPLLEQRFADWKAPATALPALDVAKVAPPKRPRVYLVDQPGAIQATLLVGQVVPSTMDDKAVDFDIANAVLGGEFSSRLNMNLREGKHWAYGAYSFASGARGQRPWIAFAPVQIDKTAESLAELRREIAVFANGDKPASTAEIDKIQATNVRGMPGLYETGAAVMGALGGIVRYERPDDYVQRLKTRTETMSDAKVRAAAELLDPNALTWVVVGDLEQIERPVRALKIGEVKVLDADGKLLR